MHKINKNHNCWPYLYWVWPSVTRTVISETKFTSPSNLWPLWSSVGPSATMPRCSSTQTSPSLGIILQRPGSLPHGLTVPSSPCHGHGLPRAPRLSRGSPRSICAQLVNTWMDYKIKSVEEERETFLLRFWGGVRAHRFYKYWRPGWGWGEGKGSRSDQSEENFSWMMATIPAVAHQSQRWQQSLRKSRWILPPRGKLKIKQKSSGQSAPAANISPLDLKYILPPSAWPLLSSHGCVQHSGCWPRGPDTHRLPPGSFTPDSNICCWETGAAAPLSWCGAVCELHPQQPTFFSRLSRGGWAHPPLHQSSASWNWTPTAQRICNCCNGH